VLDVTMPRLTGIQAARQLAEQRPDLRILILSMHDNEQFFFEALRAGASGYVLKSAAHDDLVAACRAAMRGEPFLYPRGVAALVRDYLQGVIRVPEDPLTPRETEIVKLIAEGLTSREIGEVLHIADKTSSATAPTSSRSSASRTVASPLRDPPGSSSRSGASASRGCARQSAPGSACSRSCAARTSRSTGRTPRAARARRSSSGGCPARRRRARLRRASGAQGLGRQRRELGPPLVRSPVVAAAQVARQPRITIRQAFPSITPRARAAGRGSLRRSL
jgi:FixJ family two-component response regulator